MTNPLNSYDLYHMPEFKALCERLGIAWDFRTLGLTIELGPDLDDLVKVTQSYRVADKCPKGIPDDPDIIDTTTQQNQEWRTKRPCQHQN